MRANWDDTWLATARAVAQRSLCSRAQVGAVIVSSANRVLATGYNGPPANYTVPDRDPVLAGRAGRVRMIGACDGSGPGAFCHRGLHGPTPATLKSYEDCPSVHAEMNALMHSDRSSREGGTIYVTGAICWACAKAIANSGIIRVVIGIEVDDRSHRDPIATELLLNNCAVRVSYR